MKKFQRTYREVANRIVSDDQTNKVTKMKTCKIEDLKQVGINGKRQCFLFNVYVDKIEKLIMFFFIDIFYLKTSSTYWTTFITF